MNKGYVVYLAVVLLLLSVCAPTLFGVGLSDISSAFGAFFGVLYEARWFMFGMLSFIGLTLLGAGVLYLIWPNNLSIVAGCILGQVSVRVLDGNIPFFIASYETLPANWQSNLTLLGLVWAFLALAALGRYLFFRSPSSEPEKEDYQPGELLDWGGYYPPTDGSDDR